MFFGIIRLVLQNIPTLLEILVKTVLILRPKTVSVFRVMPSMNSSGNFISMKRFIEVGWKVVHLVLPILVESLFALNQVETLFTSLLIYWNSSPVFSSEINKFVSSKFLVRMQGIIHLHKSRKVMVQLYTPAWHRNQFQVNIWCH